MDKEIGNPKMVTWSCSITVSRVKDPNKLKLTSQLHKKKQKPNQTKTKSQNQKGKKKLGTKKSLKIISYFGPKEN